MARSAAYRKYQITINNPTDKGFTHDIIRDILSGLPSCLYWCMCDEIGTKVRRIPTFTLRSKML